MKTLYKQIKSLTTRLANAAQKVYDSWEGEDDPEIGSGGICDQIAEALGDVLVSNLINVDLTAGGHDGDDHAWVIVYNDSEAFGVDIDPYLYESGGGYSWTKIEDVQFSPDDIIIFEVPYPEEP